MMLPDPPAFLLRTPKGNTMSAVTPITPVKAAKKKRQDAYIARVTISIPLDPADRISSLQLSVESERSE
jgi:hypothetical protein